MLTPAHAPNPDLYPPVTVVVLMEAKVSRELLTALEKGEGAGAGAGLAAAAGAGAAMSLRVSIGFILLVSVAIGECSLRTNTRVTE